jgi:oxaloacetate decarboxylase gamma subunit
MSDFFPVDDIRPAGGRSEKFLQENIGFTDFTLGDFLGMKVGGIILNNDLEKGVSGDPMIFQGLKLTILGMGVVFCFLILLLALICLCSKLLAPFTEKELSLAMAKKPARPRKKHSASGDNLKLTAIISAAVAAHRARTRH